MAYEEKKQIIIDTDPGHDDVLAILLLEKSGLFDIKAITTIAGNSTIQNTTNNARYVLDLIKSTTPIYSGAEKPLKRELIRADVHGEVGLAGAEITKEEELTKNASQKIIEIVRAYPKKVSIVTIGPETNIAEAFMRDPDLPSLVEKIVIMGGAINVPGNKNRVGEFNIFVDPEAADIVFKADVKKVLVPLDVCNDIFFTLDDFDRLKDSFLYDPIKNMMEHYIQGIESFEKATGAFMYDPLAAYYLINPEAYKTTPMDIQIEIKSDLTRGMTVADRRNYGEKNYNVDVVTSIDKEDFTSDFFDILKK